MPEEARRENLEEELRAYVSELRARADKREIKGNASRFAVSFMLMLIADDVERRFLRKREG